jgi:hypothetical protein
MDSPARVAELEQDSPQTPPWTFTHRVAFRFCLVYFGSFCLSTQILGDIFPIPKVDTPDLGTLWPTRQIVFWSAAHIFHLAAPLVYKDSGSGDKTFDWILVFWILIFAIVTTIIWSALDRKRQNYATLDKWFRLFVRFALASQMINYGLYKVIPVQMPFPSLRIFVEPFGNFSPMNVLWSSIGASPVYEVFAGCAELLGGILLVLPRTAMLGAIICLADMTQVFMLNMTYDVPVKLFSFHLLLMALFLLVPEFSRLADFFLSDRTVGRSTQLPLCRTRRAHSVALAAQIVLGIWIVGVHTYSSWSQWQSSATGRHESALYGIWNVNQLSIDGQLRSPLLIDYDRWRRVIFYRQTRMAFQRMDDSFEIFSAAINVSDKTLALTKDSDQSWKANFRFQRVVQDQLALDGIMDGHTIRMQLQRIDLNKFLILNRGFHWIQEYPFNR